jgi:nicotinamidase-related amidase
VIETIDGDLALAGAEGKPPSAGPNMLSIPCCVAPLESETIVSTGVDKFVNTELEKVLKSAGTQTVIATGTSAHGAALYKASTASLRGLKVVLPVDGISADTAYIEQFVAVHMTTAPLVSRNVTLSKLDLIRF